MQGSNINIFEEIKKNKHDTNDVVVDSSEVRIFEDQFPQKFD